MTKQVNNNNESFIPVPLFANMNLFSPVTSLLRAIYLVKMAIRRVPKLVCEPYLWIRSSHFRIKQSQAQFNLAT